MVGVFPCTRAVSAASGNKAVESQLLNYTETQHDASSVRAHRASARASASDGEL